MENTGYAVIDLETTGFSTTHRILEVGVVLLRPDLTVERTWETLIQPGRDIPNSHIHHITATDVVDAPSFADIAACLGHLLNGRILVAHNASFERGFLKSPSSICYDSAGAGASTRRADKPRGEGVQVVRDRRRRLVLPVRHVPGDVRPRGRILHRWALRSRVPVRWAHRRSLGDLGTREPVAALTRALCLAPWNTWHKH